MVGFIGELRKYEYWVAYADYVEYINMYTVKHAFILGVCNVFVGSCVFYCLNRIYFVLNAFEVLLFQTLGALVGSVGSEYYFTRFSNKHALSVLWALFAITYTSLMLVHENSLAGLKVFASLSFFFNSIAAVLLQIAEIGYLVPFIKENPDSYTLSVLLSLTSLSGSLWKYLDYLSILFNMLFFTVSVLISLVVTWNFKILTKYHSVILKKRTELPFSVFSIAFYSCGAILASFSIVYYYHTSLVNTGSIFTTGSFTLGSFAISYIIRIKRPITVLILFILMPFAYTLLFILNFELVQSRALTLTIMNIFGFTFGVMETLIMKLIIINSNRPEFFLGMWFFLTYLFQGVSSALFLLYPEFIIEFLVVFCIVTMLAAPILYQAKGVRQA